MTFYECFVKNNICLLEDLTIQYKDFAAWHNKYLASAFISQHKDHWKSYLANKIPSAELRTDYPRPELKSTAGACVYFNINETLTAKIRQLAESNKATTFMIVTAATNLLLYRFTKGKNVMMGVPVDGRDHPALQNLIGYFLNVIPLTFAVNEKQVIDDYLSEVRSNILLAFEHKSYPLEMILDDLKVGRDPSRNVAFEVNLVFNNHDVAHEQNFKIYDLKVEQYYLDLGVSKNDLKFSFSENSHDMRAYINYCTDLFIHETAVELKDGLLAILESMSADNEISIEQLLTTCF